MQAEVTDGGMELEMFVYYFMILAEPFDLVERKLVDGLYGLGELAGAAYRDGEEIRARIGFGDEPKLVAKTVRLDVSEPARFDDDMTIRLVWEATGPRALFPRMEGELIVAGMGPNLTQLLFRGSYRPPLGALGRAADRVMLHRVAEATVQNFVERLAMTLTSKPETSTVAHDAAWS